MSGAVLEVEGLNISFHGSSGTVHAVRNLSLSVAHGEVVGVVGESGSGKSVTMMSVVRLLDTRRTDIRARRVQLDGKSLQDLSSRQLESVRGPVVSYIFQDPLSALNPLLTVGRQITEGMRRHQGISRSEARRRAIDLLRRVGIPAPEIRINQLPHQMSGGMRQRVMIAIALATDPKLLIADEPTTALDVTVQAEIVRLVQSIQSERGMAMVWVTHDLALLAKLAHRVVVMYAGRIVEDSSAAQLYSQPSHPYTAGLLASTSRIDDPFTEQDSIPGTPPDPKIVSPGCSFAPFAVAPCHVACWRFRNSPSWRTEPVQHASIR
jgi:oligopeptide/dipeptide ABC transporter ATP-binding protein